ncbi:MAG: gamma-glutamyl-phosphate reductase, partial [Pseudomonadota bacterium]
MKDMENISELMAGIGAAAKAAATELGVASAERKHAAMISASERIWAARSDILAANAKDLDFGREKGLSEAMM